MKKKERVLKALIMTAYIVGLLALLYTKNYTILAGTKDALILVIIMGLVVYGEVHWGKK